MFSAQGIGNPVGARGNASSQTTAGGLRPHPPVGTTTNKRHDSHPSPDEQRPGDGYSQRTPGYSGSQRSREGALTFFCGLDGWMDEQRGPGRWRVRVCDAREMSCFLFFFYFTVFVSCLFLLLFLASLFCPFLFYPVFFFLAPG